MNVASPKKVGGMVLGSIVPLVLVLMTITGAIYPAIDLTAGERERGTLETLLVCPVPPMELITGKYLVVTTRLPSKVEGRPEIRRLRVGSPYTSGSPRPATSRPRCSRRARP